MFIALMMLIVLGVSLLPVHQIHAATSKKYLVVVREYDGTYKGYDDLIYETKDKNLLIKAKPIAEALGLTYKEGNGNKKSYTIANGINKLAFTSNSKKYVFYKGKIASKRTAPYKASYIKSYEMIHYTALSDLINCSYYASNKAPQYINYGYSGVIIYDYYNLNPKLPEASEVFETSVKPEIMATSSSAAMILASFSIKDGPSELTLDLSEVLDTYKKKSLPYDGVYGYGNCDGVINIQAVDGSGITLGTIATTGKEFMVDFPGAQKLIVTGEVKNLMISFTPVKPIIITDTVLFATSEINWLSPDGNARQYFILPPYTQFNFYNYVVQTAYSTYRQSLEYGNTEPEEFSSGYQMLALIFYRDINEFRAATDCGVEFRIVEKVINRSNVLVYDTKDNKEADNYEAELLRMREGLKTAGLNKYFPSTAWDKTLTIKIKNGVEYGGPDDVSIQPGDTDLNETYDYVVHLHEMTHFYEQQIHGYGIFVTAWAEGNAISLSKLALKTMKIDENGVYNQYNTNWSFLTEADKTDFEKFYLTVKGWNAYITGYHFNCYLRENYGDDVIYRILQKASSTDLPYNKGKSDAWSKQFAECIKAETSQNVFSDFIKKYVMK